MALLAHDQDVLLCAAKVADLVHRRLDEEKPAAAVCRGQGLRDAFAKDEAGGMVGHSQLDLDRGDQHFGEEIESPGRAFRVFDRVVAGLGDA